MSDTVESLALDLTKVQTGLDAFFLLFAGAAVFLMQAGFAMLCAGSVRQKNVKNIMLKNLLDACGGALGFFFCGNAIAYGGYAGDDQDPKIKFIGDDGFLLFDLENGAAWIGWFFQFAFAATAATIVAGTVAERCKMSAYLCYSVFLTAFVYPVVVRSTWSPDGFLSAFNTQELFMEQGVIDFAGSGVVHLTGGITALIAAIILGPRKGRFYDENGNKLEKPKEMPGHSTALQVLGTFILWFGWYGFNPGSALVATGSADVIGLCAVTTTVAAASGAVSAMFTDTIIELLQSGEVSYDPTMAMNGCLGGLVAVTAGCCVYEPWVAVIIGVIAGWVYFLFSKFLVFIRVDDAVDAIPVHFANGIWGVIAVGLFAKPEFMKAAAYEVNHVGWFYNLEDPRLLIIQLIQIAFIIAWVSATMIPFFVLLRCLGLFRVDPLEEEVGLDISHHRGAAYNLEGPEKGAVDELQMQRESKHGRGYQLAEPQQFQPQQQQMMPPTNAPPTMYEMPSAPLPQSSGAVYGNTQSGGFQNDGNSQMGNSQMMRGNGGGFDGEFNDGFGQNSGNGQMMGNPGGQGAYGGSMSRSNSFNGGGDGYTSSGDQSA